jgi:hypothetical protein
MLPALIYWVPRPWMNLALGAHQTTGVNIVTWINVESNRYFGHAFDMIMFGL